MIRRSSRIAQLLAQGGPFVGDNKPTTRITTEPSWFLNKTTGPVGNFPTNKLPLRWWQDVAGNGTEVEIPNLKTVIIDRQLNQDADTIEVDFYNTFTPANGTAGPMFDAFGERGYLAPFYADTPQAQQTWNQTPTPWKNLLRENSLLRVYQGYGGWLNTDGTIKSLAAAISDGSVILTGVFLVDTVAIEAQTGIGKLVGRSMAKLLIDQPAWPPLVPGPFYTSAGIVYYHDNIIREPAVPGYGSPGNILVPTTGPYGGTGSANYTVLPGDTLWAIAGRYYGNPLDWPQIWNANPQIADPNLIFPGEVLVIPNVSRPGVITWTKFQSPLHPWSKTVYDMMVMPDGNGYRLAGTDGYVYNYGSAAVNGFIGGAGGAALNAKIVSIDGTPSGKGYWLLGGDGSVFAFGDAKYHGRPTLDVTPGTADTQTTLDSTYTVVSGDTLWAIAGRYYGNPLRWPDIWHANTFIIDPDLIFPGQVLVIPNVPSTTSYATSPNPTTAIAIRRSQSGNGYWVCGSDGKVYSFGDAGFHGDLISQSISDVVISFTTRPQGDGYWLFGHQGGVYGFNAPYRGSLNDVLGSWPFPNNIIPSAIDAAPDGNGYQIVTSEGAVYHFGSSAFHALNEGASTTGWHYPSGIPTVPTPQVLTQVTLNAPITGIQNTPDGNGFYVLGADGSVFAFGDAKFKGALPGTYQTDLPGNYTDYSDIVSDFLLWSGFYLHGATAPANTRPAVFGAIETTGAFDAVGPIPPDTFDKKQIIDIIKLLRDTVGYIFRVREDGSVQFTPANIWESGNYYSDGTRIVTIPVIDERVNMTDYIQTSTDQTLRSQIIVAPVDPYLFGGHPNSVTVTNLIPPGIQTLRGMVKPAMIGVPLNVPITVQDQNLLAEIQALFCWLGVRTGQVSCAVDPGITPDDQIQILERSSGETDVHYVTGVHTEHDLDSGSWLATYTTQWMGGPSSWAITSSFDSFFGPGAGTGTITDQTFDANGHLIYSKTFTISDKLAAFLGGSGSRRTSRFQVQKPA